MSSFENTPLSLSYLLILITFAFTLEKSPRFQIGSLFQADIVGFFASFCIFDNFLQTISGLIILYQFRKFEKQMGSRKFAMFFFLQFIMFSISQILLITLLRELLNIDYYPATGPYFLIFSLFSLYFALVPQLKPSNIRFLRFNLSEKSLTYMLALPLIFVNTNTFLTAVTSLVFGALYLNNAFSLQSLPLPIPFVALGDFLWNTKKRVFGDAGVREESRRARQHHYMQAAVGQQSLPNQGVSPPPTSSAQPAEWMPEGQGQERGEDWGDLSNHLQRLGGFEEPPPESEIEALTALGFSRERSMSALLRTRRAGGGVEHAAEMLLTQSQ